MQISKFWAVACSAILCVSLTRSGAVDNEAQKKAREALENQLSSQPDQVPPPAVSPTPAPAKPKAPKKEIPAPAPRTETPRLTNPSADTAPLGRPLAVPSQPFPAAPRPVLGPVPERDLQMAPGQPQMAQPGRPQPAANVRADADKISKAREAMRQKMNEVQAQHPEIENRPEPTPAPQVVQPMPERPAVVVQPKPEPSATVVKRNPPKEPKKPMKSSDPAANFEAVPDNGLAKNNPPAGVTATPAKPSPQVATPQPAPRKPKRVSPSAPPKYQPLEGPPSTLSLAKQQKLDDLLRRYRADEVTPEQYHTERAKILSEP